MSDERVLSDIPVIGRIDLHQIERRDPLPSDRFIEAIEVGTQLTRGIRLNIPIISSAMDTVTEARLAIAMAQQGGLGIIHKNMPIDAQAAQVRKVKKFESGVVKDPVTISP